MDHQSDRGNRSSRLWLAVPLGLLLATAPADAQEITGVALGETAGDDVSLLLAQVSAHTGGLGLQPVFSVTAYRVGFPSGNGSDATYAVAPAVGLRSRAESGFLEGKVGYSFRGDDDAGVDFFGGGESGVTTSLHGEYWDGGAYGLQGIASYNFGSDFLWTRGRGTVRLARMNAGALHGGAEAVWQGEFEEEEALFEVEDEYRATQFGPLVQWISDAGWIGVLGGGWKNVDGADSTWYAKAELVLSL